MFQPQNPETVSTARMVQVANQNEMIQSQYIDRLYIKEKSEDQLIDIFGVVEDMRSLKYFKFAKMIEIYASARAKQLHMDLGPSEKQKFSFEKQKHEFSIRLQNQKLKIVSMKVIFAIVGYILIAFGIYAYLFQPPQVVVPSGGKTQELKVNSIMQGVIIASVIFLLSVLAIIFVANGFMQVKVIQSQQNSLNQ